MMSRSGIKDFESGNLPEVQLSVFGAIFDGISDAIVFTDVDRKIVLINQGVKNLFGYDLYDLKDRTTAILYESEKEYTRQGQERFNLTAEEKSEPYLINYRRQDGSVFPGETIGTVIKGADGVLLGYLGVIRDISDRQKIEELNLRLGRIVENSINEVYVFNAKTLKFILVNRGARENLGFNLEELTDLTPIDIKPQFSQGQFEDLLKPLQDEIQEQISFETVHQRKDGSTYPVEVRLQLNKTEMPTVFIAIIRDISEYKQAQSALVKAKELAEAANKSKSEFLANMSHELRTPLNSIIGFSQILEAGTFGPLGSDENKEYIGFIHNSGNHLHKIIGDILDLSKIESGKNTLDEEEIDMRDLIDEALNMASDRVSNKQLNLRVDFQTPIPLLFADRLRVLQVLLNLMSNAIKFTQDGGVVTTKALINEEGSFIIIVEDTGQGIKREDIKTVLEPFGQAGDAYTRSHEGAGLGLALVSSLMELHGGGIGIESELGEGTTVTATFPPERTVPH
jgi:two-component system, sensor histidine kinase and response regulator